MPDSYHGNSTSFPLRLWMVSWKLVLFVGLFLTLYIPFVLPFILYPETEYETIATARGRSGIEFLAMATVILATVAMTRYVDRKPLSAIGFSDKSAVRNFGVGTVFGIVLLAVLLGVLALLDCVRVGIGRGPFNSDFLWVTLALLFNTIQQEALVHGYVQQMVRARFGSAAGVVVSSVVLVLLHWTLFEAKTLLLLTNLFAAGVLLGIAFLYSRSLWLPIGIHFGWNYIQGPILGLPLTSVDLWNSDLVYVVGSDYVTGGSVGLEGGIVASAVLVAASAWLYRMWMSKLAKQPELEYTFP